HETDHTVLGNLSGHPLLGEPMPQPIANLTVHSTGMIRNAFEIDWNVDAATEPSSIWQIRADVATFYAAESILLNTKADASFDDLSETLWVNVLTARVGENFIADFFEGK